MLAGQCVIGLLINLVLVAVPVCHPAFVRAELLFLPAGVLLDRLAALLTNGCTFRRWMAAQMGFHRIGRKVKNISNALVSVTLESEVLNLVLNV